MPFGQDKTVSIFPAGIVRPDIHNPEVKADDNFYQTEGAANVSTASPAHNIRHNVAKLFGQLVQLLLALDSIDFHYYLLEAVLKI
jgi:hypothetical protein